MKVEVQEKFSADLARGNNDLRERSMEKQEKLSSIEEVSLQLRIPKPTLRFWEKEFEGILVPSRTPGGQRRYNFQNISILEEIKRLREEGLSLAEIKRKLDDPDQMNRDLSELGKIDLLANRVAEVVKTEIHSFFKKEEIYRG